MTRRWIVPEVIQTSAMDCGPACLQSLLVGHGLEADYARLREVCATDVDGTSIDVMEDVALELGLDAEQVMIPADHALLPEADALPAMFVVREGQGATHFVVAWARRGPVVQVMDPASGRHWSTAAAFVRRLFVHTQVVPAAAWEAFARSPAFCDPLKRRAHDLGLASAEGLLAEAAAREGWQGLAALDAALRAGAALVQAGGVRAAQAGALVETLVRAEWGEAGPEPVVPAPWWSVRPAGEDPDGVEQLAFRGAVLLRVAGRRIDPVAGTLSPDRIEAIRTPPHRPLAQLLRLGGADGWRMPLSLAAITALAAAVVVVEAVLLRGLLEIGTALGPPLHRAAALLLLVGFLVAAGLVEHGLAAGTWQVGRRLEVRLRRALLTKLPRLPDGYLRSRLQSDLAHRAHALAGVREVPRLARELLGASAQLVFTVAGICWLDLVVGPLAAVAALAAVALPLATQPLLAERDLRLRSHAGALSRFYLDALLGLVPIRTHGAQDAVRTEHEGRLVEWTRAGVRLQQAVVTLDGLQALSGLLIGATLLLVHVWIGGDRGSVLLLVYWGLNIPVLGERIALAARQLPLIRSTLVRVLEPLGAPESAPPSEAPSPDRADAPGGAPAIRLEDVRVEVSGHTLLAGVDLSIAAGEHVAIVGRSGAGKSTLLGLLLGTHRPVRGQVWIDGAPHDDASTWGLRRRVAWVAPEVRLWNDTLLANLRYGNGDVAVARSLDDADLYGVVQRLGAGLHSPLGEGGGLVSGGEGQRVRLARALLREDVDLVLLDEPFRGQDRAARRKLLGRARAHWGRCTLLCVTHDVEDTLQFPRVLVVEDGRVVEDGAPQGLLDAPGSRFGALVEAEREVRDRLWRDGRWRRLRMARGQLREGPS